MKRWSTPLGDFDLQIGDHGVTAVMMVNGKTFPAVDESLDWSLGEHLNGRAGSLNLDLQGITPMAQHTLAKLLEIPHGEVRSYAWVAREIGRPAAIRPVASCVSGNPIPILIPCHRVVRSDGHIGEYSMGGPEMKRKILEFEGVDVDRLEQLARAGVRFMADKETSQFHLPSCKRAPAADSGTPIEMKHESEAKSAHFKPCRRCRPI